MLFRRKGGGWAQLEKSHMSFLKVKKWKSGVHDTTRCIGQKVLGQLDPTALLDHGVVSWMSGGRPGVIFDQQF